jgi:hypothetical protein
MKKLLLSVFALLALVSANVFGQNTGDLPSIGSTHEYWVNGGTTSSTQSTGVGSTYTWWISTTPANLKTVDASSDYTVAGGASYNTGAVNKNSIKLTWNPSSSAKTYYLVVQEDGVSPLCTNIKAYAIQPKNNFELVFAMLSGTETSTVGDNLDRCAPDMSLSASGTTISYNYGSDNYMFKLTSKGLYTTWSLNYAFTNTLGGSADTYEYSTDGGSTYTSAASTATDLAVPASLTGTKDVFIRVKLVNGTNEGLAVQKMKLALSNIKDAGNNTVTKIYSSNGTTDITATPEQTQTVKARPATTGISFN